MRARLVRPEFWTDSLIGRLPDSVRLLYIGLWCVADDSGYVEWDIPQIAVQLMPYQPGRERRVREGSDKLIELGRVKLLDCGKHAWIPTLERHRITGGNKSEHVAKAHRDCRPKPIGPQSGQVRTRPDSPPPGAVRTGLSESRSESSSPSSSESSSPPLRGNGAVALGARKRLPTPEERRTELQRELDDPETTSERRKVVRTALDVIERQLVHA